jgi:hypothetical protein
VAGGHGMWGLAHGPVTRLLAEQITTGRQPEALRQFDPLHRTGRQTCTASRSTPPVNHPRHGRPTTQMSKRGHHHNDHHPRRLDDTARLHPPAR